MKSKTIVVRIILEFVLAVMAFSAVDNMTTPSESTAVAVTDAVNKQPLEPSCMVEVRSAIRSASFIRFALFVIQILAILLLCSDAAMAMRERRTVRRLHDDAL